MRAGGGGSPGRLAAPPPAPQLTGSDAKAATPDLGTRGLQGSTRPSSPCSSARPRAPAPWLQPQRSPRNDPGCVPSQGRGTWAGWAPPPRPDGVWEKAVPLPAAASLPGRGLTPGDPGAAGCPGTVVGEPTPWRGGFVTPEPRPPPKRAPCLCSCLSLAPTLFSLRAPRTKRKLDCPSFLYKPGN